MQNPAFTNIEEKELCTAIETAWLNILQRFSNREISAKPSCCILLKRDPAQYCFWKSLGIIYNHQKGFTMCI